MEKNNIQTNYYQMIELSNNGQGITATRETTVLQYILWFY